jgi:hypothetical protein
MTTIASTCDFSGGFPERGPTFRGASNTIRDRCPLKTAPVSRHRKGRHQTTSAVSTRFPNPRLRIGDDARLVTGRRRMGRPEAEASVGVVGAERTIGVITFVVAPLRRARSPSSVAMTTRLPDEVRADRKARGRGSGELRSRSKRRSHRPNRAAMHSEVSQLSGTGQRIRAFESDPLTILGLEVRRPSHERFRETAGSWTGLSHSRWRKPLRIRSRLASHLATRSGPNHATAAQPGETG